MSLFFWHVIGQFIVRKNDLQKTCRESEVGIVEQNYLAAFKLGSLWLMP